MFALWDRMIAFYDLLVRLNKFSRRIYISLSDIYADRFENLNEDHNNATIPIVQSFYFLHMFRPRFFFNIVIFFKTS